MPSLVASNRDSSLLPIYWLSYHKAEPFLLVPQMIPSRKSNIFDSGSMGNFVSGMYPDPWVTISSVTDPQSMMHMMRMSERLVFHNPLLARGYQRVIAFLITRVVVEDCSDEEKDKYLDFLNNRMRIIPILHTAAMDIVTYNNFFGSLMTPFVRKLSCKNCRRASAPLDNVDYKFENFKFYARCPVCKVNGEWRRFEIYQPVQKKIQLRRWSPHEMEIKEVESTKERIYFWKLNQVIKDRIKRGDPDYLRSTPWVEVECVQRNEWLKFNPEQIIHLCTPPPAGYRTGGWGIPFVLALKPELYRYQVLRRHDEGICHESAVPGRFISPQLGTKVGVPGTPNVLDPSVISNIGQNFTGVVLKALNDRKRDPFATHVLPFPLNIQTMGGDAKNLVPRDIMDSTADFILNAAGIPVDFYKATFSTQAGPMGLRMVQSGWSLLFDQLNQLLEFIMNKTSRFMSTEPATARLLRPSETDDINRAMMVANLMQAGKVSDETGLSLLNLDAKEELDRTMYGQLTAAKKQKELQDKMDREGLTDMLNQGTTPAMQQQQAQQQGQQPGGQGGGGGQAAGGPPPLEVDPNVPMSPVELMQRVQAWVDYLLPLSVQNRQYYLQYLSQLRVKEPHTHMMVMAMIEKQRKSLQQQGGQMLMAQGGGQQAMRA